MSPRHPVYGSFGAVPSAPSRRTRLQELEDAEADGLLHLWEFPELLLRREPAACWVVLICAVGTALLCALPL